MREEEEMFDEDFLVAKYAIEKILNNKSEQLDIKEVIGNLSYLNVGKRIL